MGMVFALQRVMKGARSCLQAIVLTWSVAWLSIWPEHVSASCVGGPQQFALLWSYPEPGAENVPIAASFWLLTGGAQPTVTLNGKTLDLLDTGTFSAYRVEPELLEPHRQYTLVLDFPAAAAVPGIQARKEIAFTTGADTVSGSLAAPLVKADESHVGPTSDSACPEVTNAQDCFDTGQSTLLSFDVEQPESALGWLLTNSYKGSSSVWPARCGRPSVYVRAPNTDCYQVQWIGPGGQLSPAAQHCVKSASGSGVDVAPALGAAGGAASSQAAAHTEHAGGCAAMGGGAGARTLWANAALLLVSLVVLRRRRVCK